jgi:hypothetical protein
MTRGGGSEEERGGRGTPSPRPTAPATAYCRPPHFIVGIENSAPPLMPEGHREVTVFVFV